MTRTARIAMAVAVATLSTAAAWAPWMIVSATSSAAVARFDAKREPVIESVWWIPMCRSVQSFGAAADDRCFECRADAYTVVVLGHGFLPTGPAFRKNDLHFGATQIDPTSLIVLDDRRVQFDVEPERNASLLDAGAGELHFSIQGRGAGQAFTIDPREERRRAGAATPGERRILAAIPIQYGLTEVRIVVVLTGMDALETQRKRGPWSQRRCLPETIGEAPGGAVRVEHPHLGELTVPLHAISETPFRIRLHGEPEASFEIDGGEFLAELKRARQWQKVNTQRGWMGISWCPWCGLGAFPAWQPISVCMGWLLFRPWLGRALTRSLLAGAMPAFVGAICGVGWSLAGLTASDWAGAYPLAGIAVAVMSLPGAFLGLAAAVPTGFAFRWANRPSHR